MIRKVFFTLRPADFLNVLFLLMLTSVTVVFRHKVGHSFFLILLYSSLILIQAFLVLVKDHSRLLRLIHDLIFPTLSILIVFDSLEMIVHPVNPMDIDPFLIRLDYLLTGGYPTVMLESVTFPFLTDLFQLAYSSYYFLPVALGVSLKLRGEEKAFDHSLFLIMLCFYLSYLGYLLMPAIGPRYTMNHLQNFDLSGWLIAGHLQELLNRIEGIKRDAFPSGHTGIALTVLFLALKYEKRLFRIFLPVVVALVLATVYCRYHYVVDVIAGGVLTFITFLIGDSWYGYRETRVNPHR